MLRSTTSRFARFLAASLAASCFLIPHVSVYGEDSETPSTSRILFHDAHYHPTNYAQAQLPHSDLLEIVGDRVGRIAAMGIPLHQKWDYFISGDRAPDYYLRSAASLYYYSFADAMAAADYLSLSPAQQERIDPMITGFNPTDMYASDHIRRVLMTFPGVFVGIGEFTVHKEFVSTKVTGHAASIKNPALDRIFETAGEIGLVAVIHCDINNVRPGEPPDHYADMLELFRKHPQASTIWAHTGLGRFVKPSADHVALIEAIVEADDLNHVAFDISWDLVNEYMVQDEKTVVSWADLLNKHASRFLFGTDSVTPSSWEAYTTGYEILGELWERLSPEAMQLVTVGNYERIFDAAKSRVREWEANSVNQQD